MNALQFNVEYLSNKLSSNDRINNINYDQDIHNQGIWYNSKDGSSNVVINKFASIGINLFRLLKW